MVIKVYSKMEVENEMSKKEDLESYPIRSLHDFLTELNKEWDRFRTASLIGIVTSGALLFFLIIRFLNLLRMIRKPPGLIGVIDEFIFLILVAVFVIYEISLLFGQYKFFKKWERRVGLLLHLEEKLLKETEGKEEGT